MSKYDEEPTVKKQSFWELKIICDIHDGDSDILV
jgi:hypothetical protein